MLQYYHSDADLGKNAQSHNEVRYGLIRMSRSALDLN